MKWSTMSNVSPHVFLVLVLLAAAAAAPIMHQILNLMAHSRSICRCADTGT